MALTVAAAMLDLQDGNEREAKENGALPQGELHPPTPHPDLPVDTKCTWVNGEFKRDV